MKKADVQIALPKKLIEEMKTFSVDWNEFIIKCIIDRIQGEISSSRPV